MERPRKLVGAINPYIAALPPCRSFRDELAVADSHRYGDAEDTVVEGGDVTEEEWLTA